MSNPIKIGPFFGIDNKLPTAQLVVPPKPGVPGGAYVRDALNVDLTSAGTFQRRSGATLVFSSQRASSLWSSNNGAIGYYADNGVLKSFDGTTLATVANLSSSAATVSLVDTPLGVVWTDGASLNLISNGVSKSLAIPPPNPSPVVSVGAVGSLVAGTYNVAFATVNSGGQRSAVTGFQTVSLSAPGAISVAASASTSATQVFVSQPGGTILYLEATLAPGATSLSIPVLTGSGTSIDSTYEAAMPPGLQVRYYRGRLLIVYGNAIYYSHPYNFGVYNPMSNFVMLDAPVTLCEPTQEGVFLATANDTWFSDGLDFATNPLKPLAPYGAIPNTAASEPNTLNLWWFTPRGAVRTRDDNTLEMKQDEHVAFGAASTGAALFREENGLSQVVTALSNATPTGAASATSYMSATTVN